MDNIADILANGHLKSDLDALPPWNWSKGESRLKITNTNQYVEQNYPKELLIKRLGLEGKVYIDDVLRIQSNGLQNLQLAALAP